MLFVTAKRSAAFDRVVCASKVGDAADGALSTSDKVFAKVWKE